METIEVSDAMRMALLGLQDCPAEYDQLLKSCIEAVRVSNSLGDRTITISADHTQWQVV